MFFNCLGFVIFSIQVLKPPTDWDKLFLLHKFVASQTKQHSVSSFKMFDTSLRTNFYINFGILRDYSVISFAFFFFFCACLSSGTEVSVSYSPASLQLILVSYSCCRFSRVWLFSTLWTVAFRLLCSQDSPGKNSGVGCHALLQDVSYLLMLIF